eukprot:tig00001222_g7602.t1
MASSAGDEQGGWASELFEPGEEAQAERLELTCAVCCLVMREPTSLGCSNDHALCRTCAERLAREAGYPFEYEYMRAQLKCPIDREVVDRERFRPAPFVIRRINGLKVHCRFQGRGCEWRGDLGSLAAHSERCPAGWGVCGGCGARVPVDELPAHEAACRRPCPNAALGCTARLSDFELAVHPGRCPPDVQVNSVLAGRASECGLARLAREKNDIAQENAALAQENGALEGGVEDLSGQLEAMRLRADAAEARAAGAILPAAILPARLVAAGQLLSGPAAAAAEPRGGERRAFAAPHEPGAAAVGAQAAGAGEGPGELRVAPGQSIMDAVRRAAAGQTIHLAPGVYREHVVLDKEVHIVGSREAVLTWTKDITLLCMGPAAPSVRGVSIRSDLFSAVVIENGSRAVVEDCDVSSSEGVGIGVCGERTAPTLRGNAVHTCTRAPAIAFSLSAKGVAEGNDVYGNAGAGIVIMYFADPIVRGNRVRDQKHGIYVCNCGKGTIEGNTLERISDQSLVSCGGVKAESSCAPVVRGNTFRA